MPSCYIASTHVYYITTKFVLQTVGFLNHYVKFKGLTVDQMNALCAGENEEVDETHLIIKSILFMFLLIKICFTNTETVEI
jgi:hypothetical protein